MTGKRQIDVYEHVVWSESGPTPAPGNKTTAHAARSVLWVIARRADFATLDNSYSDLDYIVGTSGAKKSAVYNALSWLEDEGWLHKYNDHACKYACLVPKSAEKLARAIMQRWECDLQLRNKGFYEPDPVPIIGNEDEEHSDNRNDFPTNGKDDSDYRNESSDNRNQNPIIGNDFQSSEQTSVNSSVPSSDLTKEEEEVVDDAIDADIENVHQPPPPHDLILEVGTPLAAREGSLPPEEENPTKEDENNQDWWQVPWKAILSPRGERIRSRYDSDEWRELWELGMDIYPTLWGYDLGDEELLAKWLTFKVGDLVTRKVKVEPNRWYKILTNLDDFRDWRETVAPQPEYTSQPRQSSATDDFEADRAARYARMAAMYASEKSEEGGEA